MTTSPNTPKLTVAPPLGDAPGQCDVASPTRWNGRTRGGVIGNWFFITVLRLFGLRVASLVLVPVSLYFLLAAPKALRASTLWRERVGYGSRLWINRLWRGYRHFFAFGQILLDRIALISRKEWFRLEFEGEDALRAALGKGKGIVLVSAHFGNWMAASHVLSKHGVPVNIVAFQGEWQHIHKLLEGAMRGRRFALIAVDGSINSSLAIMSALQRGEIVAMHGDRCLGLTGESCEFLGKPARFPTGPYLVAALTGAPIVHAFGIREGTCHYRLLAYPPTDLAFSPGLNRTAQLRLWMRAFVERLEKVARQYPLQWQNFYDFWGETDPHEVFKK